MSTYTEENYLKAIYRLSELTDIVTTNAIANALRTKAASVTDMLKKLKRKNLVHYVRYKGVSLTPVGKKIALEVIRKHRLWEYFLVNKLGFQWDEIHEIAEQLEHIQSPRLIDSLDKFLNHPKFDPHGDPIPSHDGKFFLHPNKKLTELKAGSMAHVTGVSLSSDDFLKYLNQLQIHLGTRIALLEKISFDDSLRVRIGKNECIISKTAAENILIA